MVRMQHLPGRSEGACSNALRSSVLLAMLVPGEDNILLRVVKGLEISPLLWLHKCMCDQISSCSGDP